MFRIRGRSERVLGLLAAGRVHGSLDDRFPSSHARSPRRALDHGRVGGQRDGEELLGPLSGLASRRDQAAAPAPRRSRGPAGRRPWRPPPRSTGSRRGSAARRRSEHLRHGLMPEREFNHVGRPWRGRLDNALDLVRRRRLRARQRARAWRAPSRAQAPFPLRPRAGRRPHRLPEGLQGRGRQAGRRRRDRQGLRGEEGHVGLPGGRGPSRPPSTRRSARSTSTPSSRERDRPRLLRALVLPHTAGRGGEGLRAARPRDGGDRPGRRGHVRHARPPAPGLPAGARAGDPARADALRRRNQAGDRIAPKGVRVAKATSTWPSSSCAGSGEFKPEKFKDTYRDSP